MTRFAAAISLNGRAAAGLVGPRRSGAAGVGPRHSRLALAVLREINATLHYKY